MNTVCKAAYPDTRPYTGLKAVLCPGFSNERNACCTAVNMYTMGVNTDMAWNAYNND